MRSDGSQCQCLACAQLQHQQANDTLLLVAIGIVVVIGGLVWLVGQVAGLLASGTWPEVPLSELPGILARLRDHACDPAAAWPASVRDRLSGPLGMYATLAGILATSVALGMLAWWLHQPPAPPRPPATSAPRARRAPPPPSTGTSRCCRRPSTTGRRRDHDHPPCGTCRPNRPREQRRGRAGTGRHQPRGGPPLRSHPPAQPLVYPLAYPPAYPLISDRGGNRTRPLAVWAGRGLWGS
jgi:hypothetical protein